MKTKSTIAFFLSVMIFMSATPSLGNAAKIRVSTQVGKDRNGNWWRGLDGQQKRDYVLGFFDGIHLGARFAYWGPMEDTKATNCTSKVYASYKKYTDKYLLKTTDVQIVDGLDELYEDYRNRSIWVVNAIWLVLNEISGTPRAEMDTMIGNYRKNAKP